MLLAGALLEQMPGPKYLAALRFAELSLRAPLPRAATLRQKRGQVSAPLQLALRAPASALSGERGALRFDDRLEAGVSWLLAAADALQAGFIVLETPSDLTPGARSRDLLKVYAERLARPDRHIVWAPHGPWEDEQAARVAHELSLILAFDPLEDDCPSGPIAYARLAALGARRSFSPATLESVLQALPEDRPSYVVIESERAFPQASMLQRMAEDGSLGAPSFDPRSASEALDDDDEDDDEDDLEADDPAGDNGHRNGS